MTGERKTVAEMGADFLRESAVLVAVFAPLEGLIAGGPAALTAGEVGVIVAIAGGLLVAGISMEVVRE